MAAAYSGAEKKQKRQAWDQEDNSISRTHKERKTRSNVTEPRNKRRMGQEERQKWFREWSCWLLIRPRQFWRQVLKGCGGARDKE